MTWRLAPASLEPKTPRRGGTPIKVSLKPHSLTTKHKMKNITYQYAVVALLGLGMSARADILELKNGNVLNGKYTGGTAGTVRFDAGAGMQVIETSQVIALTFTTAASAPAAPTAYAPAPAPAP